MPKTRTLEIRRVGIEHRTFEDLCEAFRAQSLRYLTNQVLCLDYNESLPYINPNLRRALTAVIAEKQGNGEALPITPKPSCILPAVDETIAYERHECGGKGQTVLVPFRRKDAEE
jgi:hypothetical protein